MQGQVSFISVEGIHQLHIFIFVLAVCHVLYCVLTYALARAKVRNYFITPHLSLSLSLFNYSITPLSLSLSMFLFPCLDLDLDLNTHADEELENMGKRNQNCRVPILTRFVQTKPYLFN